MVRQPYHDAVNAPACSVPARKAPALGLAVAGLLALAAAMGIGRFAFTPVLPMMRADAGLTLAAAGWLAAANYVGYFAGALAAVWLRVAPGALVRGSLAAIALLTALMGVTAEPRAWLALRFLAGVASAWVLVFGAALVLQRLAALHRGGLGAVMFSGVGVGIMLAGLLTLAFASAQRSSFEAWLALGAAALALAAATWPAWRDAGAPAPAAVARAHPLAAARRNARLVVCYAALGFGYIVPATFLPVMAKAVVPDPAVFGWAWPVFGAAAAASVLLSGRLAARFSNRRVWAASHALMAAGVALPAAAGGIGGIVVSAVLVGGTLMVATLAAMQEARRIAPAASANLIAAMTSGFALGQIAGPVVAGVLVERLGSFSPALMIAALALAASAWALAVPADVKGETR